MARQQLLTAMDPALREYPDRMEQSTNALEERNPNDDVDYLLQ